MTLKTATASATEVPEKIAEKMFLKFTEIGEPVPLGLIPFIKSFSGTVLVGHVSVDSGTILITDPCCLGGWKAGGYGQTDDKGEDNDYTKACDLANPGGELHIAPAPPEVIDGVELQHAGGVAVVSQTRCGDGTFPVYAYWKNGELVRLTIEF